LESDPKPGTWQLIHTAQEPPVITTSKGKKSGFGIVKYHEVMRKTSVDLLLGSKVYKVERRRKHWEIDIRLLSWKSSCERGKLLLDVLLLSRGHVIVGMFSTSWGLNLFYRGRL